MTTSGFTRLRPDAPLALLGQACLGLRPHRNPCTACAEACPVDVLAVSAGSATLAEGCLSCGQCVAACPTGALTVDRFIVAPPTSRPLMVECARVPERLRAPGALTVTCTGGLTVGHLLQLHAKATPHGVALQDRGWCGDCPAGGAEAHPAAKAAAEAAAIIGEMTQGLPPRIVGNPLPQRKGLPLRGVGEAVEGERRRLFGRALPLDERAVPAHDLRAPLQAPERARRLQAARKIGTGAVPAALLPDVTVSAACEDHRICIHVCPTRALSDTDGVLTFDAMGCIACGRCADICPSGAIAVAAGGGSEASAVLRASTLRACAACGSDFHEMTDGSAEALCPDCRKERGLMQEAWDFRVGGDAEGGSVAPGSVAQPQSTANLGS